MPLTKQYLRYEAAQSFGLVTGRKGDALLYRGSGSKGRRLAVCPALEDVLLWDMKTSSKVCLTATYHFVIVMYAYVMKAFFL